MYVHDGSWTRCLLLCRHNWIIFMTRIRITDISMRHQHSTMSRCHCQHQFIRQIVIVRQPRRITPHNRRCLKKGESSEKLKYCNASSNNIAWMIKISIEWIVSFFGFGCSAIKINVQLLALASPSHRCCVCVPCRAIHCLTHLWSVTKWIIDFFLECSRLKWFCDDQDYYLSFCFCIVMMNFDFFLPHLYLSSAAYVCRLLLGFSFAFYLGFFSYVFNKHYPINLSCFWKKKYTTIHYSINIKLCDWSVSVLKRITNKIWAALKSIHL